MNKTFAAVAATSLALLAGGCSSDTTPEPAAAPTTTAEAQGVTWQYLQNEYNESLFVGNDCSKRNDTSQCLQNKGYALESFERDLKEIAPSKTRSNMLGTIEDYKAHHRKFTDAGCYPKPKEPGSCSLWSSLSDSAITIIRMNVGNEVKASMQSAATTSTVSAASADDVFRENLDIYWSGTGRFETSIELAKTTCKTLTNGTTVQEIRDTIMPIYNDEAIVDNLISASTKAYCPKFHEN